MRSPHPKRGDEAMIIKSYEHDGIKEVQIDLQQITEMKIYNVRTNRADGSFKKWVKKFFVYVGSQKVNMREFDFRLILAAMNQAGIKFSSRRSSVSEWKRTNRFGMSERRACDYTYTICK